MSEQSRRFPRPTSITPRRLGPLTFAAALALTGCGDIAGPTATPTMSQADKLVLPSFSAANTELVGALLADLNDRVIPSLPAGSARQELADAFTVLAMALGAAPSLDGTVHDPAASLAAAVGAVTRYSAAVADDPAALIELESVKLGLSFIQLGSQ